MRERYSREERAAIVRKYVASGMTLERFSWWARVPVGRLGRWLAAPVDPSQACWLEVELVEEERVGGTSSEEAARC